MSDPFDEGGQITHNLPEDQWPFRNAQEVREALEELAVCVLHGWTEPAFVRGKLHTRAVEIAHLVLGEEK